MQEHPAVSPESTEQPGVVLPPTWIRFGNTIVPFDRADTEGADGGRARLRAGEELKVVVQEGRLFQKAYPDVDIHVDNGRFLLVSIPSERVGEVASVDSAYGVMDAAPGTAVFETVAAPAVARAPLAWVQALVDQVSGAELKATIDSLAGLPTRHSTSPQFAGALAGARARLDALGYVTTTQAITVDGAPSQNLIADKAGVGAGARQLVIVTAHLDSVNHEGTASSPAPGADDNASGSAGVLEIARVLRTLRSTHDLRLILFGGEEQGLLGSRTYVAQLSQADRRRLRAVVNMDMVGNQNTPAPGVLLEGAPVSQTVINALADAAATYTTLAVQTSLNPFASDHVPFIDAGLPAVLTIEEADSANGDIHGAGDTADKVETALAAQIVRMNVGMVATELGREAAPVPQPEVPEPLVPLRQGYSGRYAYNGGAVRDADAAGRAEQLADPAFTRDEPIFRAPPVATGTPAQIMRPRFTLHIDVDGTDALDVVSGSVARGLIPVGAVPHFIGRVTSNTGTMFSRKLVVEDFSFTWPGSSTVIDRLVIRLTGHAFGTPTAEVTFYRTSGKRHAGPFKAPRSSRYFRDVQVEVDVEDGAVNPEPYNTHTHPDRPADLPNEDLTLEKAFARAGIRITRSAPNTIATSAAGADSRWTYDELHDAMEVHWSAFANVPQWKMWIFLAELATSDTLGGVMFDGDIDEPGGVDRQGTAIFTKCPFFHTAGGGYCQANPPAADAAKRELFFDLIHETGHAFNLAHSFQKQAVFDPGDVAWPAPSWMPLVTDPQALSWMNYPDEASPGAGSNATWFYERFRFRFDDGENLFLRHAPARFVQMGNEAWFHNHARVDRGSLDQRLELVLRTASPRVQLGESVFVELRLANVSDEMLLAHRRLNPADGLVEMAVTEPDGRRRPFIPFIRPRRTAELEPLAPGERVYQAMNLTMGQFGFPFKSPGPYRIEASYTNVDGSTAAAIMHLEVLPAPDADARRAAQLLFDARVGRALNVGGTREMEDVNDRLDRARDLFGAAHPASYYVTAARVMPYAKPFKTLPASADAIRVRDPDPELVERELTPVVENPEPAADAMGHIMFGRVVDVYADAAVESGNTAKGKGALERTSEFFAARNVIEPVVQEFAAKAERL